MSLPESSSPGAVSKEQFMQWVHEALNRLYDSAFLQNHPLTRLYSATENCKLQTGSQALRRVLLNGIQNFSPRSGVPAQSPDWRLYRILELRYIEGLNPNEVMAQLSLAKSQFYRDQARVFELLVEHLWQQLDISNKAAPPATPPAVEQSVQSETERLRLAATWETLNLVDQVREVLQITAAMAKNQDIDLQFTASQPVLAVRADRVMLRQVLITLVGYVLSNPNARHVHLLAREEADEMHLLVQAQLSEQFAQIFSSEKHLPDNRLEICANLMKALGGRADFTAGEASWQALLAWRPNREQALLVVDDNRELVDLYRRYLTGTGWQVLPAYSSIEARSLLKEKKPAAILLDIMMPGEDGWEFLEFLKSAPETQEIPVLICSVVNEPALAESLGAANSLAKPISQQTLIQALSPWL